MDNNDETNAISRGSGDRKSEIEFWNGISTIDQSTPFRIMLITKMIISTIVIPIIMIIVMMIAKVLMLQENNNTTNPSKKLASKK